MKILSLALIFSLLFGTTFALAASTEASYYGGTVAEFKDAKKEIKGHLDKSDETNLEFVYDNKQVVRIPYANFIDMEYGQKWTTSGRCCSINHTAWTYRAIVPHVEKARPFSDVRL